LLVSRSPLQRLKDLVRPRDVVLSAASADGLVWRREASPVLQDDAWGTKMFYYPKVVAYDGGCRLFYPAGAASGGFASLWTADKEAWQPEEGWRFSLPASAAEFRADGPDIVHWGPGDWRLFFAASDGDVWRLFQSRSVDGRNWDGYSPCLDLSADGRFNQAKDPCLYRVDGRWFLCFTRFVPYGPSVLVLARQNGEGWQVFSELSGLNLDGWRVRTPCIVALPGGGWRMYFSRYPAGTARHSRLDCAYADDGVNWHLEREAVLAPGGRYDGHGVFCPSVVRVEDGWRLFYAGYWGRHLLEPLTLFQHRPRFRDAEQGA
jgi:hypothetical protein